MEKATLFCLERSDIKIKMAIYFTDKEQLYFDGCDSGKAVVECWGDSDYEYTYTIEPAEVTKFYNLFALKQGDKTGLLQALQTQFSVGHAYSLFGEFMAKHNIQFEGFTWA